jgi:hypothetical protein
MLPRLPEQLFDWHTWRGGSITDIVPLCRKGAILKWRERIKERAVGYCPGEHLTCRPKLGTVAIMYDTFWSHLNRDEFEEIFGKE